MSHPNIVFIMLDDLGWKDLGCYGSEFYETPNLDRLASESLRFTDAYAACPVCSPTRASFHSGKYPARLGLTQYIGADPATESGKVLSCPYVRHLDTREQSLAKTLKAAEYATWHVGKWHMGARDYWPDRHGFEINIGGCDWGHPRNGYFAPWSNPTLEDRSDGEYLTDRLTDEAIRLISEHNGAPFFLNLSYYTVHTPIQAKEEHLERFRQKAFELGLDKEDPIEPGEWFPCGHKKHMRVMRRRIQSDPGYAAMIWSLDENIGRLLKAIDEAGQTDNTIVMFYSDNGGLATAEGSPTCNAPLQEGKGWMYEGGTREPLLIKAPGVTVSGVTDAPVTTPDFYPTLLDLAGLDRVPEQHVDGESFLPLLRGESWERRKPLFWHYPHYGNQGGTPGSSVRRGDWKLLEFFEDNRRELYNLREDIGEEHDRASEYPEMVNDLRGELTEWRETVGAKIPAPNPDYDPSSWGEQG